MKADRVVGRDVPQADISRRLSRPRIRVHFIEGPQEPLHAVFYVIKPKSRAQRSICFGKYSIWEIVMKYSGR